MQTTLQINASEIPDLMAVLNTLFKKEKVVEVTVNPATTSNLDKKETRKEYWARIDRAIKNLDEGKNIVTFRGKEFDNFLAKKKITVQSKSRKI